MEIPVRSHRFNEVSFWEGKLWELPQLTNPFEACDDKIGVQRMPIYMYICCHHTTWYTKSKGVLLGLLRRKVPMRKETAPVMGKGCPSPRQEVMASDGQWWPVLVWTSENLAGYCGRQTWQTFLIKARLTSVDAGAENIYRLYMGYMVFADPFDCFEIGETSALRSNSVVAEVWQDSISEPWCTIFSLQ